MGSSSSVRSCSPPLPNSSSPHSQWARMMPQIWRASPLVGAVSCIRYCCLAPYLEYQCKFIAALTCVGDREPDLEEQLCLAVKIPMCLFFPHIELFRLNWLFCCFVKVFRFWVCCFCQHRKTCTRASRFKCQREKRKHNGVFSLLIWAILLHSEYSQIPITWTPAMRYSLSIELPLWLPLLLILNSPDSQLCKHNWCYINKKGDQILHMVLRVILRRFLLRIFST